MAKKPPDDRPATLADLKAALRSDGWVNILTAIGTARDKRRAGKWDFGAEEFLSRQELEQLWRGNALAAKIVEKPASEMLRQGFDLKIASDKGTTRADSLTGAARFDAFPMAGMQPPRMAPPPAFPIAPKAPPGPIEPPDMEAKQQSEDVIARMEELHVEERLLQALYYQRAYGGAGLLVGADDGQDFALPLNEKAVKTLEWMTVLTPRELVPATWYGDPRAPKYGDVETYRILPEVIASPGTTAGDPNAFAMTVVHESRVIPFPGILVSRVHKRATLGWGDSVLIRAWTTLRDFGLSWASAALLLQDFAQAVYKIKGLASLIQANDDATVIKRAALVDMMRSTARGILIDEGEDWERKATPLSGMPELLQQFEQLLCAVADMPATVLFGRSPAGQNATGESDTRNWYDRIRSDQHKFLRPRLEHLVRLIFLTKTGPTGGKEPDNWSIEFHPLWQPTPLEKAQERKTQMETDVGYIDAQVLKPEEVAGSRFGGDTWSAETTLDFDDREAMAAAQEKAAQTPPPAPSPAAPPMPPPAEPKPPNGA